MRYWIFGAGLLLLSFAPPAWAFPDVIDCHKAYSLADRYICQNSDVLKADGDMTRQYKNTRAHFTGHQRKIFVANQSYWRGTTAGCIDLAQDGNFLGHPSACLKDMFAQRIEFLRALEKDRSLLQSHLADYYHIDIWYLNEFAKQYQGRKVTVNGQIGHLGCDGPLSPVHGRLTDQGSSVDVEIAWLGQFNLEFLCEKEIITAWDGVVKLDEHGRPVLHIAGW